LAALPRGLQRLFFDVLTTTLEMTSIATSSPPNFLPLNKGHRNDFERVVTLLRRQLQ
jgi:hypothetical protein